MIDSYNEHNPLNPANQNEEERDIFNIIEDLSKEDREILENYIGTFDQQKNEANTRVKYYKQKEKDVKGFFNMLDTFLPANMENLELLISLAQKIKNSYGIK